MTAKLGEVSFKDSTFITSCLDSYPRGFMHKIEAAIGGTIQGVGMSDVSFTVDF